MKNVITTIISTLDFDFLNEKKVESNKDYNKYEVGYKKMFSTNESMVDHIIIETIVVYRSYPCDIKEVSNT